MSNELTTTRHGEIMPAQSNPLSRAIAAGNNINAGAVSIESERAIAEARGQMQLAKMFKRDEQGSYAELMDGCKLPALAEVAFYNVPQGGGKVSGPSIRLAEEIARIYGNFEFGHRELSRVEAGPSPKEFGRSEIEVYAWDKERNNRSIRQITVLHVLDTKDGPRKLRDQKDVDNKIANVASKQVRGRILALVPKWMVEAAIQECRKTLAGNNEVPITERVRRMTQAFARFGVTAEHLEKYIGHSLDSMLGDELADLQGVYNSIKEGTPASEFFGEGKEQEEGKPSGAAAAINEQAKQSAATQQQKPRAAAAKSKQTQVDSKVEKETPVEPVKTKEVEPQAEDPSEVEVIEPESEPNQPSEDDDPF